MRTFRQFILSLTLLLPFSLQAQNGLIVSFKGGRPFNATQVGLKLGPIAPYGAIGFLNYNQKYNYEGTYYLNNWETDQLYLRERYESHFELNAKLLIPYVGTKLYLVQSALKAYLFGEAFLIIPSIKGKSQRENVYYNPDGTIDFIDKYDDYFDSEQEKRIEDALDFMGIAGGFGVEHPFSEHFSVGGEFGYRLLMNTIEWEDEWVDEWDGRVWEREEWSSKLELAIGGTFTNLTLNYYF